jgi:hypothetical protein
MVSKQEKMFSLTISEMSYLKGNFLSQIYTPE